MNDGKLTPEQAVGVALSIPMSGTEMHVCQAAAPGVIQHLKNMGFEVVDAGQSKPLTPEAQAVIDAAVEQEGFESEWWKARGLARKSEFGSWEEKLAADALEGETRARLYRHSVKFSAAVVAYRDANKPAG
jgi:hypothetical protein